MQKKRIFRIATMDFYSNTWIFMHAPKNAEKERCKCINRENKISAWNGFVLCQKRLTCLIKTDEPLVDGLKTGCFYELM